MENKKIEIPVEVYKYEELPESDRRLVDAARQATRRAYAPYSKFHVGAAIEMADGEIIIGANQENAAFSSGTCAERSACFHAAVSHPDMAMKTIAIAAWTRLHHSDDASFDSCFQRRPISPCGACRQALLEYETLHGPIRVLLYGAEETYCLPSVASLLPFCFTEF